MCTILLATRVWPQRPLVMAANRDELLARPAEGPRARTLPFVGEVFAPLDLKAGGTWMGVSKRGLLVAITNRAGAAPKADRESRGLLVAQALAQGSLERALAWARSVDARRFNPFHLVVADAGGAFELWNDRDRSALVSLAPGLHVITERDAGVAAGERAQAQPTARPQLARALTRGALAAGNPGPPTAQFWGEVLGAGPNASDQSVRPIDAMTVRMDGAAYGTRSASVVSFGPRGVMPEFWWAEGAPDRNSLVDLSGELRAWLGA